MGSSIAYHLKSDRNFSGEVVVIERDPAYTRASSALSASSIRQQFSTPDNIHLSRYGFGFLRQAPRLLDGRSRTEGAGLPLPGKRRAARPVLRANHAIQQAEGCAVELLDPAALRGALPVDIRRGCAACLATASPTKAGSTARR